MVPSPFGKTTSRTPLFTVIFLAACSFCAAIFSFAFGTAPVKSSSLTKFTLASAAPFQFKLLDGSSSALSTQPLRFLGGTSSAFSTPLLRFFSGSVSINGAGQSLLNNPSLRQNIRVILDDTDKQISYEVKIPFVIYGEKIAETEFEEGSEVSVKSVGGIVTVSTPKGEYTGRLIRLRAKLQDEYLNYNKKYFRGEIWFQAQNSRTLVINYLDLEDYLLGVVPLEIGLKDNHYFEALKCAAVAARTFAINRIWENRAFYDVTATVKDQAYGGLDVETGIDSRSVIETTGYILTYKSKPAIVFYSANCGGYTEDIANVFGPVNLPYLKGVQDGDPPYCERSPSFRWSENYTPAEIIRFLFDAKYIKSLNYILENLEIPERYTSGRAKSLIVRLKEHKPIVIPGNKIREVIKSKKDNSILRSSNFEIEIVKNGNGVTKIKLTGKGNGHGVGMCQWGALNQSRAGVPYNEILQHYFPGTELTQAYTN
ncbi:MAG: hypothetical protein IFNCLDLE_02531 [Ignavibacteriaceae bacterium]|nr:hypothetical protein [Ignavibacteriaceae bacterium]